MDYVPFDIRLPSGKMKPAKYIKLKYGEDPLVYGMIDSDPHQYVESFQATPFLLRYCRNVRPTWVKFNSKDTKESGVVFEVLCTKSKKRT